MQIPFTPCNHEGLLCPFRRTLNKFANTGTNYKVTILCVFPFRNRYQRVKWIASLLNLTLFENTSILLQYANLKGERTFAKGLCKSRSKDGA